MLLFLTTCRSFVPKFRADNRIRTDKQHILSMPGLPVATYRHILYFYNEYSYKEYPSDESGIRTHGPVTAHQFSRLPAYDHLHTSPYIICN